MQTDKTIMIIVMAVCAILLLILLFAIFKKFIKNMTWRSAIICGLILIAIIAGLAYLIFASRGTDSIFSSAVDGKDQGDTTVNTGVEEKKDTGTEFTIEEALEENANGDKTVYIHISGTKITIGEHEFEDIETFGAGMQSIHQDAQTICLMDDYAQADTFKAAQDKLKELGIPFSVVENE